MLTYKKAFEEVYKRALIEYYSGDYVPLLLEPDEKTIHAMKAYNHISIAVSRAVNEALKKDDHIVA